MESNYTKTKALPRGAKWQTEIVFDYHDSEGQPVFCVHRQIARNGPNRVAIDPDTNKPQKRIFQVWPNSPDKKKPRNAPILPYQLPQLMRAVARGETIFIAEGEPKVEVLLGWGLAATCNAEGAGKWKAEHAAYLKGANVVILPDNDEPGRRHTDIVGRSLQGVATSVRLLELPGLDEHGDIVDWERSGGDREKLLEIETFEWKPYFDESSDPRVEVVLRAGMLHQQADETEDALIAADTPIHAQAGRLVRVVVEKADATRGRKTLVTRVTPCDRPWLMREISKTIRCVTFRKLGRSVNDKPVKVSADVPKELVDAVKSSASDKFPELAGIIETPTLRPDGSILQEPGYDAQTGLLLVNPPAMSRIAERPTEVDAMAAMVLLNELLREFPFADEMSRSVALSALIMPVVRGAMTFAPLHVASAPEAGTGKSYLFDIATAIASGKACPVLSAASNDEETEKRLNSAALSGQTIISIDNLNGVLRQIPFLCQLLTQETLLVRILGVSELRSVRNTATVFANGNNIQIESDLVRRTIRCELDTKMENPETREFKANPFKTVLADRGKYVAAALTIVRAYQASSASHRPPPALGGFDDWTRLVRGALIWLGRADPVETQVTLKAEDPGAAMIDSVLEAWVAGLKSKMIPDIPLSVKQLLDRNDGNLNCQLGAATYARDEAPSPVKVGLFLKRHKGRIRHGVTLHGEPNAHTKQQTWWLENWQQFAEQMEAAAKVVPLSQRKAPSRPLF
jgi:putative DNA primase/helicase